MRQRILENKLGFILFIAIVVRVTVLFAFPGIFDFVSTGAIHGSDAYDKYALNLNETGIYGLEAGIPDAAIPPMYGYLLSVVYSVFGRSYLAVGFLHIWLDVLSIGMLYQIGLRLFPAPDAPDDEKASPKATSVNDWIPALAALFMALYPYLIFQNLTLIDTPLFITALHAFVLVMVLLRDRKQVDRGTLALSVIGGVILGVATFTRPFIPLLGFFVALWFLFRLNLKETIVRLLPVALVSALMLVPWIYRNYQIFERFIPMSTTSGGNLWQGNSPLTIPVFQAGYDVQWTGPTDIPSTYRDPDADAARFAEAIDFLRNNPDKWITLFGTKFLVHWNIDITPRYNPEAGEQFQLDADGNLQIVKADQSLVGITEANTSYDEPLFDVLGRWIHRFYFGALLILAILGVWLSRQDWRKVSLVWFVQIWLTVVYVIFHPSTRYRVPSDPLLFVLSAVAVVWLAKWWQTRTRPDSV